MADDSDFIKEAWQFVDNMRSMALAEQKAVQAKSSFGLHSAGSVNDQQYNAKESDLHYSPQHSLFKPSPFKSDTKSDLGEERKPEGPKR